MFLRTMKLYIPSRICRILNAASLTVGLCAVASCLMIFGCNTLAGAQALNQSDPLVAVASAPGAKGFALADQALPSGSQHMHLVFALKTADLRTIQAFVDSQQDPASPNYHRWITAEQFGQMFGASDSDVQAVSEFLQSRGFADVKLWPSRTSISVSTDVDHVNAAFGVHVMNFVRPAKLVSIGEPATFFSPDRVPTLPVSIAAHLAGVLGLSDIVRNRPSIARASRLTDPAFGLSLQSPNTSGTPYSAPLVPADLSKVYDIDGLHTAGADGTGMKIAIFSPTERYASDITKFATQFNLGTPTVEDVSVDGGANAMDGPDEAALDGCVIVGQAPKADIRYYDCPNTLDDMVDCYNQMLTDNVQVVSSSWGSYEDDLAAYNETGYEQAFATTVASLSAHGITMFNDSGDYGAFDEYGSGVSVQFEAADPNITGVGGTALPTSNNGYWNSEVAWTYDPDFGDGGGGGLSTYFTRPSWQTGPGVSNSSSDGYREVPDISALADPNTPGYYIIFNGNPAQYGGTSASTPLWASSTLLMDELYTKKLGNINPSLYSIGTNLNPPYGLFAFHDITSGNDGVYSCTLDWDFVTGWGSADFTKLYDDMTQLPDFAPNNPGAGGPGGTWTSPIMIHAGTTSVTEPSQFNTSTEYRFAASVGNYGNADGVATTNEIVIDGAAHPYALNPIQKNTYSATLGAYFSALSAGSHTIELIANTGKAGESPTTNDTYTRTITVTDTGPPALNITLSTGSTVGGNSLTGTVTLGTASSSARTVTLSGATSYATFPATVTVPANATSATFTINTVPVQSSTNLAFTATYSGSSASAFLMVTPALPATANVSSVTPSLIEVGAPSITITVKGSGFAANSYVTWDSQHLATTYVNSTTLTAVVPASLLTKQATAQIAVVTPSYQASNGVTFTIGPVVLQVASATAVRDAGGNIFLQVTLQNISPARVGNVVVQIGTLNGKTSETALPISLGSLPSGSSNTVTLEFPPATAASKTTGAILIEGIYAGGAYANSATVSVP